MGHAPRDLRRTVEGAFKRGNCKRIRERKCENFCPHFSRNATRAGGRQEPVVASKGRVPITMRAVVLVVKEKVPKQTCANIPYCIASQSFQIVSSASGMLNEINYICSKRDDITAFIVQILYLQAQETLSKITPDSRSSRWKCLQSRTSVICVLY